MNTEAKFMRVTWKVILLGLTLFFTPFTTTHAVDGIGLFELDANAQDEGAAGDDWQNIANGSDSAFATTGILADPYGNTIFTGGGSKDPEPISNWKWRSGSVPPKDEITNAYAAAYAHPNDGDLIIYVGADRFGNNGDAEMGLWLFQEKVATDPSSNRFTGKHNPGDLLFVAHFQKGGKVANLEAYVWRGDGQGSDGNLDKLDFSGAECAGVDVTGCALTNAEPTASYWPYTPSKGEDMVFPENSFFEGGFNITELFALQGIEAPCFASFLVESRSSTSVTATLKDFVVGEFEVCGIEITKSCDTGTVNADETALVFDYSGTVANTGFGTLYNVEVVDNAGTPTDPTDDQIIDLGTLGKGETKSYSGSFESTENPPTNTASVSANPSSTSTALITDTSDPAECPQVDRDPAIQVTKECSTDLRVMDGKVVVGVNYNGSVCNTGDIGLDNVDIVDRADGRDDVVIATGISLEKAGQEGECYNFSGDYLPTDSVSVPGDAMFTDTVTATGEPRLGLGSTVEDSGSATCPLCPTCPTCP